MLWSFNPRPASDYSAVRGDRWMRTVHLSSGGEAPRVTTSFPEWLDPMAATLTHKRFTGPEWIFERKLDGIRLLAFKHGPDVRLLSRNRLPQNAAYPSIAAAIAALPVHDVILDGEATGVWGPSDPERRGGGRSAAYHVFDIPWL